MPAQSAASAVKDDMDDDGDVYYDSAEDAAAYHTAKLTFSTIFPLTFGVRIIHVCILYSNFYSNC